ncbi:MAG: hypothetical protein K2X90_02445 [Candidatus Babeliaceae bacterium]|nr:hypothetical protein [Candidatus Babeliaceae bacterium]
MNASNSIIVTPSEPKKTISTFGLCGCLALVIYARKENQQFAYLSHDDPLGGIENRTRVRALQAVNKIVEIMHRPETIDIFLATPGEYGQGYQLFPKHEYENLNDKLLSIFSKEFPQAKVSAKFIPYSMDQSVHDIKFYEGGRDIIVELDPDYKKSVLFPKSSFTKIMLNQTVDAQEVGKAQS